MKHGRLIKHAILLAEALFPEHKSGKKKREWVVKWLNDHIDIPLISERREEQMLNWVIGCFCDVLFERIK